MINKKLAKSKPKSASSEPPFRRWTEQIVFRVTKEERQAMDLAVGMTSMPMNVWLRERLRVVLAQELSDAGVEVPFLTRIQLVDTPKVMQSEIEVKKEKDFTADPDVKFGSDGSYDYGKALREARGNVD